MDDKEFTNEIEQFFKELETLENQIKLDMDEAEYKQKAKAEVAEMTAVNNARLDTEKASEKKLSFADQWFAETQQEGWKPTAKAEPVEKEAPITAPAQSENKYFKPKSAYEYLDESAAVEEPDAGEENPAETEAALKRFDAPKRQAELIDAIENGEDEEEGETEERLDEDPAEDAEDTEEEEETGKKGKKKKKEKKKKKKWSKTRKVLFSIICILLALLLAAGGFLFSKLNMINTGVSDWDIPDAMTNDIDAATIDSITDAASLTALLRTWANNGGDHMHSKYVKNVLLLGVDSDSQLSDTIMLASVNRRTNQVSLVSFYRDSYTYINVDGKGQKVAYAKLNAAYKYGGPQLVMKTLENNYKVDIDEYLVVDYNSFPTIIDKIGGVTVNVTEKEAQYLNQTWWKWSRTGKKIQFTAGDMKMDGEHALMYCRIRKLDSDINRTERQRKVINALMDQFSNASLTQINDGIDALLPFLTTSMSKGKIVSYATQALTEKWLSWTRIQTTMPPDDCCVPGYAGTEWIWVCDYEGAAYQLQNQLYGQTNIQLAENRVSALSFSTNKPVSQTSGNKTGSSSSSSGNRGGNGSVEEVIEAEENNSTAFGDDLPFAGLFGGGQRAEAAE